MLPDDICSAVFGDRGPEYREAYKLAQLTHALDELGKWEAWRLVIECVNEFGHVPDPCCCCAEITPQGAHEVSEFDRLWLEAVTETVKNYPSIR